VDSLSKSEKEETAVKTGTNNIRHKTTEESFSIRKPTIKI